MLLLLPLLHHHKMHACRNRLKMLDSRSKGTAAVRVTQIDARCIYKHLDH